MSKDDDHLRNGSGAHREDESEEGEPPLIPEYKRLLGYRPALLLLAALAVLGAYTLTGVMRIFILILVGGLALKVVVFHYREKLEDSERPR